MRTPNPKSFILQHIVTLAVFLAAILQASAQPNTYWTGPVITFNHDADTTTADMLTTNHVGADAVNNVWLTRSTSEPLYNTAAEGIWDPSVSPANTLWAVASGDLTDAASLTYDTFANVVGQPHNSPKYNVGTTFFVEIVSDHIYLTLTLTSWGSANGGSFSYTRSTPPPPPTFWTGPAVAFSHGADSTTVDMLTSNHQGDDAVNNVWLTRGTSEPLFNAADEVIWDPSASPAKTLWAPASGNLTDAAAGGGNIFRNLKYFGESYFQ